MVHLFNMFAFCNRSVLFLIVLEHVLESFNFLWHSLQNIRTLFVLSTDDESATAANQPAQGSFMKLLPPQLEAPEKQSESQ